MDNRFEKLKQDFEKSEPKRTVSQSPQTSIRKQFAATGYEKKGRYPFSLYPSTRYEKLEELVDYHSAKSASDYLEKLIIDEWNKIHK